MSQVVIPNVPQPVCIEQLRKALGIAVYDMDSDFLYYFEMDT